VVLYYVALLICITLQSELIDNPNRAGFLAIAQLPVVFLFATKNSLLSLALGAGRGWEKLNFLHRWSGRGMLLGAAVHGSLWIRNHLQYGLPILGQQKETSGVATFALLCAIVLTSLRPVRAWAYQFFFVTHILILVAFFITLCYHTIYAKPWIYPPLAFYGIDLFLRMFRFRVKDATLFPCDDQMTIINVNDCDGGWVAGQHVRLRVFFDGRIFESHPLTILSAPPRTTCLSSRTLILGARAKGDWTRALNAYARANSSVSASPKSELDDIFLAKKQASSSSEKDSVIVKELSWMADEGAPVQVMIDGPYGGSSVDLGEYESVLLVSGGSGVTFALGMLDDIVGRCVKLGRPNGERTKKIEFSWCIRSFGFLRWFAPMLMDIALLAEDSSVDLHISVFVTCLCDPESVPAIPNSDVLIERPTVHQMLNDLVTKSSSVEGGAVPTQSSGGGLAVCAAGPETMTREAKNALARIALIRGQQLGKVACHTEIYSL